MYFSDLPSTSGEGAAERTKFQAYLASIDPKLNLKTIANNANFNNSPVISYAKLRATLSQFDTGAICGSWFSKTSKIIGRAMNCAAPGDTLHVLAGHFVL